MNLPGPQNLLFPALDKIRVTKRDPLTINSEGRIVELVGKLAPRIATLSECAGFLTAKMLGLPTLEGWLVPGTEGALPFFASTRETLVTLKEAGITYDGAYWEVGVDCEWFRQAFVFDTLIGNCDRVLRNMCFREVAPNGSFVFMDHDKIFFRNDWSPEFLFQSKGSTGHNNLTRFLPRAGAKTRKLILKTAQQWQMAHASEQFEYLDSLADTGLAKLEELEAMKDFLKHRIKSLTPLVYAHLNRGTKP